MSQYILLMRGWNGLSQNPRMDKMPLKVFEPDNVQMIDDVFAVVHKIVNENPDADYFDINDMVHDELKKTFKYTHELRKEYQIHINFLLEKKGRK